MSHYAYYHVIKITLESKILILPECTAAVKLLSPRQLTLYITMHLKEEINWFEMINTILSQYACICVYYLMYPVNCNESE